MNPLNTTNLKNLILNMKLVVFKFKILLIEVDVLKKTANKRLFCRILG